MWRFDRRFGLCPSHEEAKEVGKTFRFGLRERKSKKPKEPKEPKERKPYVCVRACKRSFVFLFGYR